MRVPSTLVFVLVIGASATPVGTEPLPGDDPSAPPAAAAPGKAGQGGAGELEEFVPSEEVSADRAISLPVDI